MEFLSVQKMNVESLFYDLSGVTSGLWDYNVILNLAYIVEKP